MSFFEFSDSEVGTDSLYLELCSIAAELKLRTALRKRLTTEIELPGGHTYLFIYRDEEAWRIPAFLTVMKTIETCGWHSSLDRLRADLLGYSASEISAWVEDFSLGDVNFLGQTTYFVLSNKQAANVRLLGCHSLDPKLMVRPITVFHSRWHSALRPDAWRSVSSGRELARASLDRAFFAELFPKRDYRDPTIEIYVATMDRHRGGALNEALRSDFQFFGPNGWSKC
jgi:hypothetical protein